MFTQKRLPGVAAAAIAADLIDDYPAVDRWHAPFSIESEEPSGYEGLDPFWAIIDSREHVIGHIYCQAAARVAVRALNAEPARVESAEACPVVIRFKLPNVSV